MGINLEAAMCPACGTEGVFAFTQRDLWCGLEGEFSQRSCESCESVFLSPRVPESDIVRFYPDSYGPYSASTPGRLILVVATFFGLPFRRRKIVEKFVGKGKLLDVGCGSGAFLATLQEPRWQKYASDIERHLPSQSRVEFHRGRFDQDRLELPQLDAITMWHVFEHLYHPRAALDRAAALLKPGGYLFLAIPDLENLDRRIFGRYWVGWDVPRHIATYSKQAVTGLLGDAGLRLVEVVPDNCTGEFMAMNLEFWLRSRGHKWNLHQSMVVRILCAPWAFVTNRLGMAPAKVYVSQK